MPLPAALEAHVQGESTRLAYLWKITLLDASVLGFTSADLDISYDGVTYKASTGFFATEMQKTGGVGADNINVKGPLGGIAVDDITREMLYEGRLRGGTLEILIIDREDPDNTAYVAFKGTIGEIQDQGSSFEIEVRSFDQKLRQNIGSTIQPLCDAEFADARCGLAAVDHTFHGEVTAVTSTAVFADTVTADIIDKAADHFGAGKLTWLTGDNAGIVMDMKSFSAAQVFTLYEDMPNAIQVGDTFEVTAGCRKRRTEDCKTKFNNVVNHRGFPDVPGDKFMLTYAQPK